MIWIWRAGDSNGLKYGMVWYFNYSIDARADLAFAIKVLPYGLRSYVRYFTLSRGTQRMLAFSTSGCKIKYLD